MKRQGLQLLLYGILLLAACSRPESSPPAVQSSIEPGSASTAYSLPAAHTAATLPATDTALPTQKSSLPEPTATPKPVLASTAAPSITPTMDTPVCEEKQGQILTSTLETETLPQPLDFRVYLPPCYGSDLSQHYPVLYLIHGQSFTDDQWDRMGVDETADRLIAAHEIPPFLIVMPRDRMWSQPAEDHFGDAVAQDLVPWIDAHYRTFPERSFRAVGGLSRGAGWAIHLGLSDWQLFGAVGAHSLAVFWSDTYSIKSWLSAIPADQMPRFYLDIGDNDRPEITRSATWFENLLTLRGIPHEWYMFPGYHEEKYWSAHIEQYLRWYAAAW